jgi:uncharacterized protein YllA (UPF0747 family)
MTTNFHELGYWNAHDDLHNKNAEQVADNIKNTLKKMRNDGYKRYDKEEEKPYLTWQFGRKKINKIGIEGVIRTEDYQRDDMIAILYYHLEHLLEIAVFYDKTHYFFIEPV